MGCEGEPQLRPRPAAAAQDALGGALGRSGSREATPAAPPANSEPFGLPSRGTGTCCQVDQANQMPVSGRPTALLTDVSRQHNSHGSTSKPNIIPLS